MKFRRKYPIRNRQIVVDAMQLEENSLDGWPLGVYKDSDSVSGYAIDIDGLPHSIALGDGVVSVPDVGKYIFRQEIFMAKYEPCIHT